VGLSPDMQTGWQAAYVFKLQSSVKVTPDAAAVWADAYVKALQALQAPPVPAEQGRYRSEQPRLFQHVAAKYEPGRIPGGAALDLDTYGPTGRYVDCLTGWPWRRKGGDWTDKLGALHGPDAWITCPTPPSTQPASYTVDSTAMLAHLNAPDHPWALHLACDKPRDLAGLDNGAENAPWMLLTYDEGTSERWPCLIVAALSTDNVPATRGQAFVSLPLALEFERPSKPVKYASLSFTVLKHWSGPNGASDVLRINPIAAPINTAPIRQGVAASSEAYDAGINAMPSVLGSHTYKDGDTLAQWSHPTYLNFNGRPAYCPSLWGGAQDPSKLPHAHVGKWVHPGPQDWQIVPSTYAGDGFKPLAPGLASLRMHMPKEAGLVDGTIVGYSGSTAGNSYIFLPDEHFGRLGRIFVRYYVRLAGPWRPGVEDCLQVQNSPGLVNWTTSAGKFGIGADHCTSPGGVSGTSGGPYGWQMRLSWYDCLAGVGGPNEGGTAVGFHHYDYGINNPPGHKYNQTDPAQFERWGQQGGLGGMLYADKWYCVETEVDLNTISDDAPGYLPDGACRAWLDGRLVYERTGFVMRTGPVWVPSADYVGLPPCRELGVKGLWLNWFHGGKTWNGYDRVMFITGLVYGTKYIGPMKGLPPV
jgi:hypothetical protein